MSSYLKPLLFRHGVTLRKISAKGLSKKRNYGKMYECDKEQKQGCLPWQNLEEETDNAKKCKPCKPKSLMATIKELTVCEKRRFEKCMALFKSSNECMGTATDLKHLKYGEKEYPMQHAVQKKCLPGCPVPEWREIQNSKR